MCSVVRHYVRAVSQPHFNHSWRLPLLPQESHSSFGEDVSFPLLSEGWEKLQHHQADAFSRQRG